MRVQKVYENNPWIKEKSQEKLVKYFYLNEMNTQLI